MIKCLTCNGQGLRDFKKRRKFFYKFHEQCIDIIFLQETHATKSVQKQWKTEWGGHIYFSNATSNSRGVAVLFAKQFNFQLVNVRSDEQGRVVEVRLRHEEFNLMLVNVYAPNEDSPQFFREVFQQITSIENHEIILGGDFNLVLDIEKDKEGGRPQTNWNSQAVIHAYMEELNLIDIWRVRNPEKKVFTWTGTRSNSKVKVRLDYFLVSDTLMQFVEETDIKTRFISDHAQPTITLNLNRLPRGKGTWKFNVSLLKESEFVSQVNDIIDEEISREYESARHRWEVIKLRVRGIAIQIATQKKRDRNLRLKILEDRLQKIEQQGLQAYSVFWNPQEIQEHKLRLHREIEEIIEYKTYGASLRCKVNWAEFGSKPTRYFLNLEKYNFQRSAINRLRNKDGTICTSQSDIQDIQTDYFRKLYADRNLEIEHINEFFRDLDSPKLSASQRAELDLPVTKGELSIALRSTKNFKTPGPDGFCAEFYKFFWLKLRDPLWEAMKEAWKFGFDTNMMRSLITLLGKKDRDLLLIENWRPISLLNVDYKIIAKTIANRVQKILPDIIGPEQRGFIPGRFIGENVQELINIIDFCDEEQIPSLLLSFDYRSAFDSVNWTYFDRVLEFYGFGMIFRQYMRTLYTGIQLAVISNGYVSSYLPVCSGFRQGCVLSPGNFALALHPLILKIQQSDSVQGITIPPGLDRLFGLFADDIWAVIFGNQRNLTNLLSFFENFSLVSGLQLNYNKTQIMRIGSLRDTDARFYTLKPLHWVDNVKILGIKLGTVGALLSNFDKILERMQQITSLWSNRSLNLMGKVVVCNSLLLSIPVYQLLIVANPPANFFIEIKKIVMEFLWEGRPPRIRYSKIITSKAIGGLSLVDLHVKNIALKASWVPRLVKASPNSWMVLAYRCLPISNEMIWECNITAEHLMKLVDNTKFWNQVWIAWVQVKKFENPITREDVLLQVIWYNSKILRKGKPWFSKELSQAGLNRIHDCFDENAGRFLTYNELCTKLGIRIDIMLYNSVIASIPQEFKLQLNARTNRPASNTLLQTVMSKKQPSKYISRLVRFQIEDRDSCKIAWQHDLDCIIDETSWNQIVSDVYLLTIIDHLRWFQYRLIHRILTTNVLRNKYDNQNSSQCTFCHALPETVYHLFIECPVVKKFWQSLIRWVKYIFDIQISLEPYDLIFNRYAGQGKQMINMIILIAKHYIYSTKCYNNQLSFMVYSQKLAHVHALEKSVALRQGKIKKHEKKWYLYTSL